MCGEILPGSLNQGAAKKLNKLSSQLTQLTGIHSKLFHTNFES